MMSSPAIAIAVRGLVMLASKPHRAVMAAMVALLVIDHAPAGDQAKLDGDDEHEPGGAGADEGQPEWPARAQRPSREQDFVLSEPGDEPAGKS